MEFNPNSTKQLSLLLFGGTITQEVVEPIIDVNGSPTLFKTGAKVGQIKTRKIKKDQKIKGLGLKPLAKWKTKKRGIYSTDDEVLSLIAKKEDADGGKVASLMLTIRGLSKQISTYYDSTEEAIYPDNCVHPNFIHVQNETSRLACKNINAQNQPKSDESKVKEHFTSRWGEEGCIIEVDFSQQEPCVSAQLSGDKNLIEDIVNENDLYCKYLAKVEKESYETIIKKVKEENDPEWTKKRKQAKIVILAGNYGAGLKKRTEQSGLPEEKVKELMEADGKLYPQLAQYNDMLSEFVKYTAKDTDIGYYCSPFHKRYYFKKGLQPWDIKEGEYIAPGSPQWKAKAVFPFTKMKNYMIQGTATDLTMIMMGRFFREVIKHRDKFLLINTVHDSIVLDCKNEFKDFACNLINSVLSSYKEVIKKDFNIDWIVPIRWEISTGRNWYECGL